MSKLKSPDVPINCTTLEISILLFYIVYTFNIDIVDYIWIIKIMKNTNESILAKVCINGPILVKVS